MEAELLPGNQPEPRISPGELGDRELRLELPEIRAQAVMQPLPERHVPVGAGPVQVELIRPLEGVRVPASGGEPEEQPGACGQIGPAQADRPGGDPPPHRDGRVEAQGLGHGRRNQRRIAHHRRPPGLVLQQPPDGVADQPGRGLMPGERQREQNGRDLVQRQPGRILGVNSQQVTGQVVAGIAGLASTSNRM